MEIANSIFYFIITIAILVLVHELGHFIAAKLSGMRVDTFAVGFGQRLFGWNKKLGFSFGSLPKVKDESGNLSEPNLEGQTDYRLCLLPLGGYVKIAGMIDESMDKSFLKREPQPWEFRTKSTGKKIFVLSAGVIMNFLLAFLIFWGINFVRGKQHFKTVEVGYVAKNSPAEKVGFKFGDKILSIDGNEVKYWDEILNLIFVKKIGEDIQIVVDREGKEIALNIARDQIPYEKSDKPFIIPKEVMLYVGQVFDNTPAKERGIKAGDIILSVGDVKIFSGQHFTEIVRANPNKELSLTLQRDKDTVYINVTPNAEGKIGVGISDVFNPPVEYKSFNIIASFVEAGKDCYNNIFLFYSVLKKVIIGKVEFSKAFGGPVRIAQIAARSAESNLLTFLNFIALLSLSLAILNILPFPVLDGGHLIIVSIEGILRREIPPKVKIALQNVGFVILLLFMAFVIYNDILHF